MALEVSIEKTEKDALNSLAELRRLQLERQVLKTENNEIQVSYETLSVEKDQLQSIIAELEIEKATTEEREAIPNTGGILGRTEYFIDSIIERCYRIEDRLPSFKRTCYNLEKEDPPFANVH